MDDDTNVKLNWWGMRVTRNQYFVTYYISMALCSGVIGFIWGGSILVGESLFVNLGLTWAILFFGTIIIWTIEALIMNKKFNAAEENLSTRSEV